MSTKSPSDLRKRNPQAGFTLLESVLALAILGLMLGSIYAIYTRNLTRHAIALQDYQNAALASALLDEYVVTFPSMQRKGIYGDGWMWEISEVDEDPYFKTEYDHFFQFVRITAKVSRRETRGDPYQLSRVVARRVLKQ